MSWGTCDSCELQWIKTSEQLGLVPHGKKNCQTESDLSHYSNNITVSLKNMGLLNLIFLPPIPLRELYYSIQPHLPPPHTVILRGKLPDSMGEDIWKVLLQQHGWPDLNVENAFKQQWMYDSFGQGDNHCLLLHLFHVWCIEADSLMHSIGRLDDGIVQPHKRGQL